MDGRIIQIIALADNGAEDITILGNGRAFITSVSMKDVCEEELKIRKTFTFGIKQLC